MELEINRIKNIIFDFGGVLYEINHKNAIAQFFKSNDIRINIDEHISSFKELVEQYESGKLNTQDFIDEIIKRYHIEFNQDKFKNIWNSILIKMFPDIIETVKKFKYIANICLLSNTNELHYNKFKYECDELFRLFEKSFFSYQIGMVKPNPEIYYFVLQQMNYKADETLFIDDLEVNIETANKIGLQTYQINEGNSLEKLLGTLYLSQTLT